METGDVNLSQGTIQIRGGRLLKDRTLPLKPNQILELMNWLSQTRKKILSYHSETNRTNPKLFLSLPKSGQKRVTNGQGLEIWKGLTRELKTQNPKLQNLRQIRTSVIVGWLKQYNMRKVQELAGHRKISTTEQYKYSDVEDLRTEVDHFHPF